LKSKSKDITILFPSNLQDRLPVDSPHHKSRWDYSIDFSGLNRAYFRENEIDLITQLIQKDQWIEEETNDLIKMVRNNVTPSVNNWL